MGQSIVYRYQADTFNTEHVKSMVEQGIPIDQKANQFTSKPNRMSDCMRTGTVGNLIGPPRQLIYLFI